MSIISFTSIFGISVGIASASFTLIFSIITGIVKKLLNITRSKKKKHDKILMLAKSKFNSIISLISQVFTILNEKDKYERMKENVYKQEIKKRKTKE